MKTDTARAPKGDNGFVVEPPSTHRSYRDRKRIAKWTPAGLAIVLSVAQFIPVNRSNPPVGSEVPASVEVRQVLRRACYNCHSNETVWPWYSHVAPVSWLVAHDVHEGREKLNFSTWNRLKAKDRIKALNETWEEVEEGEMPPWIYVMAHADARLSEGDRELLRVWSTPMGGRE